MNRVMLGFSVVVLTIIIVFALRVDANLKRQCVEQYGQGAVLIDGARRLCGLENGDIKALRRD